MENQIFLTVISGTIVFVTGQISEKFILKPIQQYKQTVGRIDNRLKFYSNILTGAGFNNKLLVEITDAIRTLSCDIESDYKQIPFKNILFKLRILEKKQDVAKVAKGLIFLSNAGGRRDSGIERCDGRIADIRRLLKIESLN